MRKLLFITLLFTMILSPVFASGSTLAQEKMSREVGQRILNEYSTKKCTAARNLTSTSSAIKSTKERCEKIAADLESRAGCKKFSLSLSHESQVRECKKIVDKLPVSVNSGGSGGSSGSGGTSSNSKKASTTEIGELGKLDISSVKKAGVNADDSTITSVVNIAFSLAGALALLFIAIGGLRFILSRGDPQSTAQARNTILFAVIGLVITMFAYAIVRFVVGSL